LIAIKLVLIYFKFSFYKKHQSNKIQSQSPNASQTPNNENNSFNPFLSGEINFNAISNETERELENILFNPPNTSNLLGEELTSQQLTFDTPATNNNEIDDLLFFQPSSKKLESESDLFHSSNSNSDIFEASFNPNKSQKTEQLQTSSQNRSNIFDLDSIYSNTTSPSISPSLPNYRDPFFSQPSSYFGYSQPTSNPVYRPPHTSLPNLSTSPSSKQPYLSNLNFSGFPSQNQSTSQSSAINLQNQLPPFSHTPSSSPPPLIPTNSFCGNSTNTQSQLPSFQSLWSNSNSSNTSSSVPKPVLQQNNRVSSPSAFTPSSPSNLYSAYVPSSSTTPSPLKQEPTIPSSSSSSFSLPNNMNNQAKPHKVDEKAVLSAFGKLELGDKK